MAKTQQEYLREIVGGFMPDMNKQRRMQYEFLRSNALRTGQSAASALQSVRPFAEASGQAAAEAGVAATNLARRGEEFDVQQANWLKQFEQGQTNFERQFEQRDRDQQIANAMSMYQQTGVMTPEMMDLLGFGDATRGGQRDVMKQLEILGINSGGGGGINAGFNRPNPALQKLGLQSYGSGSGGGGAATGYSTPQQPFRRVTGANQGPGLMSLV